MTQSNTKNQILNAIKWVFAISFIIAGLATILKNSFIGGLLIVFGGTLLIPKVSKLFKEKISIWQQRPVRIIGTIAILLFGMAISGSKMDKNIKKENYKVKEEEKVLESVKLPNYEILKEITIRYDEGKSYFVLIDEVDLTSVKFITDVKMVIDKIIREKEGKISIEILDNREALELMYKSNYGQNSLGRILNKSELKQLEKHLIASFSGELETMPNPNTLDIFPSSQKINPQTGKYKKSFEYNPNSENIPTASTNDVKTENGADVMDNSEFWNNYDRTVKLRIYKLIKNKDCQGLQNEFNTTYNNTDSQIARTGKGNSDLMDFIDDKMIELGCRRE